MKKNDIYEAEITDCTAEGSGVCRIEGMAVFVPNTAVGDKCMVRIVKTEKRFAYGKLEKLTEASPDRTEPDCAVFSKCGGCAFRHISYEAELRIKRKRVYDALTRIGEIDGSLIGDIVGSQKSDGYRNKAQFPITADAEGRICMGFFAPRSHRPVITESCALQSKEFAEAQRVFLEWANSEAVTVYDERTHKGILRHLYIRSADKTGELMVCIVANARELRHEKRLVQMLRDSLPGLKTVVLNINMEKTNVITGNECRSLYGDGYITDELCGLEFRISPLSFYQVNRAQAERLYGIAAEFADLREGETLIDMYCGTGTIGLSMAHKAKRLIGVEVVPQAVEDARLNAERNGITNAQFICSDASQAAKSLAARGIGADCIILDPPRKGCDAALVRTVSEMTPKRIVYVSCDPATLARDVKLFAECGYSVMRAVPVDMFPRTVHVETVVLMSAASRRSQNEKSEWEKYGEYFMNRSVSDIMSEYSEQHDEWH